MDYQTKTMESVYRRSERPGVYKLKDKSGKTKYVGKVKAHRIAERMMEHKAAGRIPFSRVEFKPTKSHAIAKKLEKILIRKMKPPYNRTLKKARRYS